MAKKLNQIEKDPYPTGTVIGSDGQILLGQFSKNGIKYKIVEVISGERNIWTCSVKLKKVDTGESAIVRLIDLRKYNS